ATFAEVDSIEDLTGYIVTFRPIHNLLQRAGSFHRCAHGEKVVFTNENDRQLVQRGEIQRFVERPLIDRAVAEEAERHAILAPVLDRKSQPNPQWYVRGDDRVAAIHVVSLVEKMHRPTEASRAAGFFPEKLGHACIRGGTPSKSMTVITI